MNRWARPLGAGPKHTVNGMTLKIGFIGLGAMGLPMFRNLAKQYPAAQAYDLCADTRRRTTGEGLNIVDSLSELNDLDIAITMLPNGAAVRSSLVGGPDGAALLPAGVKRGGIILDMSSSSPLDTASLATDLEAHGITLADAPVSGSVPKAKDGTLSIMLGASDTTAERVTQVLRTMGSTIIRTGGVGTAHAMKALNNYVYAAGLMAASEALIMGKTLGLDLEKLVEVFNCSSGRNVATETKLRQHMLEGGDFKGGFGLHLMAKDLGITRGLHEHLGFLPGQLDLCYQTWQAACVEMEKTADNLEIARFLETRLTKPSATAA